MVLILLKLKANILRNLNHTKSSKPIGLSEIYVKTEWSQLVFVAHRDF